MASERSAGRTPAPPPETKPHAGLVAASLISGALALFMVSASLRGIFVAVNRAKFVPDEAVILNWDFAERRVSDPRARIVSSGEEVQIDRYNFMELDEAQALENAGKLEGHRTPVFYLPPASPWSTADNFVAFRIQSPEQFALGFPAGLLVANLLLAVLSVVLFRRGLRRASGPSSTV
ncbi:MAG: hypothetical protein IT163_15795 [Bryobacterales bacterium]|nr:hypothetical protein [Bryobacterales bacterium]